MTTIVLPSSRSRCSTSQQLRDVVEVQAGRGLIEDIERAAGGALGELARQFHALGFAARQRGRVLPELQVGQAHVHQRLRACCATAGTFWKKRSASSTVISSTSWMFLPLVTDLQRLAVVALALADIAGHVDVRQKMHLDLDDAVALTGFAAPALDVEAETARLVAARTRFGYCREQFADRA